MGVLISADLQSLVVVGLTIPDVIRSVDHEVSRVDVVALAGSLKQLRVVDYPWLLEVQLLVLHCNQSTFMFTPQILRSSA